MGKIVPDPKLKRAMSASVFAQSLRMHRVCWNNNRSLELLCRPMQILYTYGFKIPEIASRC